MAFPSKDALLVPYSTNFNEILKSAPATYGVTEPQVTAFAAVQASYLSAVSTLDTARAGGTRSESLTAARDAARDRLLSVGRELYAFVSANTNISDEAKIALGVHVRRGFTPRPAPTTAPTVAIAGVVDRTVKVTIYDPQTASKRGKPKDAVAAWVYTYVGDDYPSDPSAWDFQGAATRYSHQVVFPSGIPGGTKVFVMAAWINGKQQSGPPSLPVSTCLQGGGAVAQQASRGERDLKIAA